MKQNSKRLTSIIIAALFLVVAFVVYLEFIVPAYTDLQAAKGQEQSEKILYDNENQIATEVKSLITTYQGESSSSQSVSMALPVGQNLAGALAQIYGIAANTGFSIQTTGVTVQAVQVLPAQAAINSSTTNIGMVAAVGGSIVRPAGTITLQLGASGTYEALKSFLKGLENNIRLFDVTGISIQPSSQPSIKGNANPDQFNYTISIVTYYQSS